MNLGTITWTELLLATIVAIAFWAKLDGWAMPGVYGEAGVAS